jgi:hypothetical protein
VDRHPDSNTLAAFREHRLSGAAVAEVAQHVGECSRCAKVDAPAGKRVLEAIVDADEHLSDDDLDVLVDDRTDDPSYDSIARHAAVCAMCRAEAGDLRTFAAADGASHSQQWWIAASVIFALIALPVLIFLLRRSTPTSTPAPAIASNPPAATAPQSPAPQVVASIADGQSHITLLDDGSVVAADPIAPRDAEDVRAVLAGRAIAIPTFIAAMPGAVRGVDTDAHPLRAIEPFRSAVVDARPQFSWTPVRDARSYRVAVFDANYDEVAHSDALDRTSWTPAESLPAGVDLSWHVVAETETGEISSTGSDRAEAVFRVLTPKEAAEVDAGEARYGSSHLMRGLIYSRYGLLHDAEREFRSLAKQNPDSPIVRELLESVSR